MHGLDNLRKVFDRHKFPAEDHCSDQSCLRTAWREAHILSCRNIVREAYHFDFAATGSRRSLRHGTIAAFSTRSPRLNVRVVRCYTLCLGMNLHRS